MEASRQLKRKPVELCSVSGSASGDVSDDLEIQVPRPPHRVAVVRCSRAPPGEAGDRVCLNGHHLVGVVAHGAGGKCPRAIRSWAEMAGHVVRTQSSGGNGASSPWWSPATMASPAGAVEVGDACGAHQPRRRGGEDGPEYGCGRVSGFYVGTVGGGSWVRVEPMSDKWGTSAFSAWQVCRSRRI